MKIRKISVAVIAMMVMTSTASAARMTKQTAEDAPQHSRRGQLVYEIVSKWGPHVQEAYKVNVKRWTHEMAPLFNNSSLDKLQDAANARTFEQMNDAILGKASPSSGLPVDDTPSLIGDVDKDLVYTPVVPCRIIDTRLAGGIFQNNTSRNFDVTAVASYTGQGGSNTNCGIGNKGAFKAVVVSFTTTGAAFTGNLTAYPLNTPRPGATTMTYLAGQLTSNSAIVPIDQTGASTEMTIFVTGRTHVLADVVGYFDAPARTPLECVESVGTPANRVNGGSVDAIGGVCPATYTLTGGECNTVLTDSVVTDEDLNGVSGASQRYNCQVTDRVPGSGGTDTITAVSRCCRVPGR